VYQQFESQYPDYVPIYFRDKTIEQNVQWFYQVYGIDHDDFYRRWQKYRACEFEFVQLDLHAEDSGRRIGEMLKRANHSSYVWTSNAFYMDYQMFYYSKSGMHDLFLKFSNDIRTTSKADVVIENCNGIYV
jgi:hypothetical protein